MTEYLPPPEQPLSPDLYLTPESISIAALVDQLFNRIDHPERSEEISTTKHNTSKE